MARAPKPVRTVHYRDIAASIEAQAQSVLMLLSAVQTAVSLDGEKMSPAVREGLEKYAAACQAAMWPSEDEAR